MLIFINCLHYAELPPNLTFHQKKKLLHDVKSYLWQNLLLFKNCIDRIIRCVPLEETQLIIDKFHSSSHRGHFGPPYTTTKML